MGCLEDVDGELWERGGRVHDRAGGAACAWSCGEKFAKGPFLALLPDTRQAADFVSDRQTLFPDTPVHLLNELPLTAQTIGSRPLLLQRGETVQRWIREGGILVATPGAVMASCLLGDEELLLKRGEDYTRDRLIAWLERSGYQRSDLVWSPGQYILRGFIMDVFDPAHALPLRFEFFDETLERIRAFHPGSQKSVAELEDIELHSVSTARSATFVSLLPDNTHMMLYEPQKIESQANSYHWLWEELCKETNVDAIPPWDEVFMALARYPRLRVTRAVEMADGELDIDDCPPFKGDFSVLLRLCADLHSRGYRIEAISANPRFLDKKEGPFSHMPFIEVRSGRLSSGFVDRTTKSAFFSDRELAGVSTTLNTAWRAPA